MLKLLKHRNISVLKLLRHCNISVLEHWMDTTDLDYCSSIRRQSAEALTDAGVFPYVFIHSA